MVRTSTTDRAMNILHAIRSLDPRLGGPAQVLTQTVTAHARLGHLSEVASLDGAGEPWLGEQPCRVHALGPGRGTYGFAPGYQPWLAAQRGRFDVVVVHGLWQHHGLATRRALAGGDTPYVVFPHGMLDPWFKRAYPLKHAKKWLYWTVAEQQVIRDAAAVLFTSEEERLLARTTYWRYRAREQVVGAGIAMPPPDVEGRQEAAFHACFPHLAGMRVLLFLGRIHPKKGCDLLLQAFAAVAADDARLHLLMAGPDADGWCADLRRLATRLGIAERITWGGMLEGDAKWGALRSAELFALPSHQENFGIAVAEALACGLPVLISRRVNIWREVIEDGAGLAEEDTVDGATTMLRQWCGLGPASRAAMAVAAGSCFHRRFAIERTAERLAGLFAALRERSEHLVGGVT
jgi:glycosyltransferase involved in cell wall biosynthesis